MQEQWAAIWEKAKEENRDAVALSAKDGVYLEFESAPGFSLMTQSLEMRRSGIRLLNVRSLSSENEPSKTIERATVFIPSGKERIFLKKLNQYAEQENESRRPKNANLMESIENINLALVKAFWCDDEKLLPRGKAEWCEIWLRNNDESSETRFQELARQHHVDVQNGKLRFPERIVLLAKVNREQLSLLVAASSDIAEFRRAKEVAGFFLELDNKDQAEWAKELISRLQTNPEPQVSVCVLDTGVNNGHVLLRPLLPNQDLHAVDPNWGVNDHDGHGTLMSGLAAWGDLIEALSNSNIIQVDHCLESVKILPPPPWQNDPSLYGDVTIQAISRAEVQAPERIRIGCMAVTATDGCDRGRPSSWSAAIDKLTSGAEDGTQRLFIVSAGNVEGQDEWKIYPKSNLSNGVQDPGQSWNALTVGAFTEKAHLKDPALQGHVPLAQPGELSPFSSTSVDWERKWPIKPEIVLEGGNLAKDPSGFISNYDDLSLLSISHQPTKSQFSPIHATSAAAAQAAWMAAQIQSRYPNAWPETVRGLLVHSAEWPDALKRQVFNIKKSTGNKKRDYFNLLRTCGYGVPNLGHALVCASNSLTLISQAEIQPYEKRSTYYSCKDMLLHQLPWPKEELEALGEIKVKMRITLSYFIEPGPGEVGWRDRYLYASCGLRFDLNSPYETESEFMSRINAAMRNEDDDAETAGGGGDRWTIGKLNRGHGSIHSDIWEGTAAEIAACNLIGVYPVRGWWRERTWLNRWDHKVRYSLIVSLHTPEESIDIYTPVLAQIKVPVVIPVGL